MSTIKLKNGHTTSDARIDRIVNFDPRSKNFSIGELRTSNVLRSYTWRCNKWFDQGSEGACVAYSLGHELAARPSEVRGIGASYLIKKIYWEAQRNDPWPGGDYPGAEPVYGGTSVLAGVKAVVGLGHVRSYRWAFNTHSALMGIGHNGPMIAGVTWLSGMMSPDKNGFVHYTGSVVGGHAVLVRAINIKNQYITIRNSWGYQWGIKGDCYMSFNDFDKMLKNYGEGCFLLNRKTKFNP